MIRLIVICSFLLAFVEANGFYMQYGRTNGKHIGSFNNLPVHFDYSMLEKLPVDSVTLIWRYQIMDKGDSILALQDGTFNVFLLEDNQWKNLYLGKYSGYNFFSNAFIKDGNLYSIGGYGYWVTHCKLIRFDFQAGGWDLVTTYHTPENLEPLLIAYMDKGITLLFGEYKDQTSNTSMLSSDIYTLDYSSWSYSKSHYAITLPNHFYNPIKTIINTSNYCVSSIKFKTFPASVIYNKKNGELRLSKDANPFDLYYNQLIYVNGETILKYDPLSQEFNSYDLQAAFQNGEPIIYNQSGIQYGMILVIISLCLLVIIILRLYRKKIVLLFKHTRGFSGESDLNESHPLFSPKLQKALRLLEDAPDEIDSNDLDEIFGISDLPHDLRRVKRSQMLNKINEEHFKNTGKVLIKRIRQEDDRRYIKYRIHRS